MSSPKSTATKATSKTKAASSPSDFKKKRQGGPLELPSGLVIIARRVELRAFLETDSDVPNPLLGIIEDALNKGKDLDVNRITGLDGGGVDLNMVNEMYAMVDAVTMSVCVQPPVHPKPATEDERDDDLLYIDEFDDEDKMFLFQWSQGGTEDIAAFRKEATESLVSLAEGKGTEQVSQ